MQIVIDIPEGAYEEICKARFPIQDGYRLVAWIKDGTPLPKEHGRLIDATAVWEKLKGFEEYYQAEFLKESNAIHESAMNGRMYGFSNAKFLVQDAPTIIEADREVKR